MDPELHKTLSFTGCIYRDQTEKTRTGISDWYNTVLDNFVCSDIYYERGLILAVEKAMNNPPLLNLEILAVIRQYFGKENHITKK